MTALNDTICFVSSNEGKISEAQSILKGNNIMIKYENIDLFEYQGGSDFISASKCKAAALIVEGPVIVEDTALCFNALHGLPGPYIKYFSEKLGSEGLFRLLADFEDKSATALCTLAFSEGSGEDVKLFHGETHGTIVSPRGKFGFGWDSCFLPQGEEKTYGELSTAEKNNISHRKKALMKLKVHLLQRLENKLQN